MYVFVESVTILLTWPSDPAPINASYVGPP